MDLTSIEATSVAIRAGQVAAAELCNLLSREAEEVSRPIEDWFNPQPAALTPDGIEALLAIVDRLGGYVCHSADPVGGERLYRWAVIERLCPRAEWADQPFARRQAFELFAATVRSVYLPLRLEQQRLEQKPAPQQASLALEDSIFEPEEPLGTLRPEAIAAAPLIAAYDEGQRARRLALVRAVFELGDMSFDEAAGLSDAQLETLLKAARKGEAPAKGSAAAPLSIGEAPPTHRGNRGGRGKTKD